MHFSDVSMWFRENIREKRSLPKEGRQIISNTNDVDTVAFLASHVTRVRDR